MNDRQILLLVLVSALLRLLLAQFVTGWVLVDDAYIHLRYARQLVETGAFVYNPGEAVFGVTSPLYALLCAGLEGAFGGSTAVAVIVFNVVLWSIAALVAARSLPERARLLGVAIFVLAPSFVDNQLLGMEAALFALLILGAATSALAGRVLASAAYFGPALLTRPEAVLLAPWLVAATLGSLGRVEALRALRRPAFLALLLGPGLAWAAYATAAYGSVVPQSMVAKSGWNNAHYDGLFTFEHALLAFPRLTFVPFVDHLPAALRAATVLGVLLAVAMVAVANVRAGSRASRMWLGFYATYIAFYLAGKGATEASWYAVPSSVALLLAAEPLLTWRPLARPAVGWSAAAALALASVAAASQRAPLLASYVEGYGRCASALNAHPALQPAKEHRVVIGEIGVFGYVSAHAVTDVGALVSPEVLPWKNEGATFVDVVRRSGASAFVISQRALDTGEYPSLSATWSGEEERRWLASCELVASHLDKRAFLVPERSRALGEATR